MNKQKLHIPSLILGIAALATTWATFGISGIVCGIIGMALARKAKLEYRTAAGFVMSMIAVIASAIMLFVFAMMLLVLVFMPGSVGAHYIRDTIWFLD